MSSCERCWHDAGREAFSSAGDKVEIYHRMIADRDCTPEQQAGDDAKWCAKCGTRARHEITGECMRCADTGIGREAA